MILLYLEKEGLNYKARWLRSIIKTHRLLTRKRRVVMFRRRRRNKERKRKRKRR
jgi:hypothetical protein